MCTVDERRSFEGKRNLVEERSSSGALRFTSNTGTVRLEEGIPASAIKNIQQDLDFPKSNNEFLNYLTSANIEQVTVREIESTQDGSNNTGFNNNTYKPSITQDQKKENQKLADEENISDNQMTLNILDITRKVEVVNVQDNEKEQKNITKEQLSTKQTRDSCNEAQVILSNSNGTKQVSPKSDTEIMVKTQLCRQRKPIEIGQPTQSNLRACKKGLGKKDTNSKKTRKETSKKHSCLYCKRTFLQLTKHLENKHAEEMDVAHAIHFPKGSKVRQRLLDQLRNKGDYEHNCQVLKSGEGEIVTKKQAKNTTIPVHDFLPCQHCFAFYRKTDLWRHEQLCNIRKEDQKSCANTNRNKEQSAASSMILMPEFLTGSCKEMINIMHQDDISKHIRFDPLICKFGNALSAKYDNDKSQFAYIAQKMRELGRFVLAVNELDKSVKYLHEICLPSRFELAVEGVKKVGGFDPTSSKFKTISLVSKIGYSLKRAAEIAFGESRMMEDSKTEIELKKFIHLLDTKWSECFSRKALVSSVKQVVKSVEVDKSNVTEDLMKLHRYITGEEDEARAELKENPSMSTWKKLSEATLANVCLFNRGRVGNIGRLLLQTYTQRKNSGTFIPSTDQLKKSTKLELELGSSFTRLELEGQFGRNMLVLLTDRMVSSIDLLVETREQAGVSKTNTYLFARTEGPSFIRGLDCFRRAAVECGVKNPEALLSSSLREQIACCWQIMNLTERKLDQVAKLLGKSNLECQSLSQNASQLEEVSKQLLKMDQALLSSPPNIPKNGKYAFYY